MTMNFISATDSTSAVFWVILGILIIALIIVPIIKRNSSTGTPTDASNEPTKQPTSTEQKKNKNYFRYQPDKQKVSVRSADQLRIVNEYFIIKNKTEVKKNGAYLSLGVFLLIAFGIAMIVGIWQSSTGVTSAGAIGLVVGVVLLIIYKATMRVTTYPGQVMTDKQYDALVKKRIDALDLVSLAFTRLGITESDIVDEPIVTFTYVRDKASLVNYTYEAHKFRTSTVCASVILRTKAKLYVYKRQFDMCCNDMTERAAELCYDDICDVSVNTERAVATALEYVFDHTETSLVICTAGSNIVVPLDVATDHREIAEKVRIAVREGRGVGDVTITQETTSVSVKKKTKKPVGGEIK